MPGPALHTSSPAQVQPQAPNSNWPADRTSIGTRAGWLSLAVGMDVFSHRSIGWSTPSTLARGLVLDALQLALQQCQPGAQGLQHRDRGSHDASAADQAL